MMLKLNETVLMRVAALCIKPFLKSEEAMIYCNLGTHCWQKMQDLGVKNCNGITKKRP